MHLTLRIGPNGEVTSSTASGVNGLSGSVVSCITSRASGARFAPPEGGGAVLVIPIGFYLQE
jgi:hypothetical protein